MGNDVWRAINSAFDVMPLAALIDGMVGAFSVATNDIPRWFLDSTCVKFARQKLDYEGFFKAHTESDTGRI